MIPTNEIRWETSPNFPLGLPIPLTIRVAQKILAYHSHRAAELVAIWDARNIPWNYRSN
jgi:hypothetical protein